MDVRAKDIQRTQLKMDLVKHVSTLSSGSIVILATFLAKSSPVAAGSGCWLVLSVFCMVACLVSALVYFWMFGLVRQWERNESSKNGRRLEFIMGLLMTLAFCFGISFLAVFVMKNLA